MVIVTLGQKHRADSVKEKDIDRTPLTDFPSWDVLPPDTFVNRITARAILEV